MCEAREVGSVTLKVTDLVGGKLTYDLTHNNNPAGKVTFNNFVMVEVPSFVDILRSGYQLSMAVAIDFTASNGDPSDYASLHRL